MTNHELSIVFFLALAAILLACRLVGYLARFVGQPQVVGEMIAGVLIGPSLLGLIAPQAQGGAMKIAGSKMPKRTSAVMTRGSSIGPTPAPEDCATRTRQGVRGSCPGQRRRVR